MPADDLDDTHVDALAALRRRVEAQSWDAGRDRWQAIGNALEIPPRRDQRDGRIAVTVRIEWEHDGAELIDTLAMGWTTDAVLVEIVDPRWQARGVWVTPGDVRRR